MMKKGALIIVTLPPGKHIVGTDTTEQDDNAQNGDVIESQKDQKQDILEADGADEDKSDLQTISHTSPDNTKTDDQGLEVEDEQQEMESPKAPTSPQLDEYEVALGKPRDMLQQYDAILEPNAFQYITLLGREGHANDAMYR